MTSQKIKKGEIKPNEDQKQLLEKKDFIVKDMKDLEKTIAMYKEAFPDNPAFSNDKKKKDKPKKQTNDEI